MNAEELRALGLQDEQIEEVMKLSDVTVREAAQAGESRAEEAYHQLEDAMARIRKMEREREILGEIERLEPRDARLVARLIDPEKDVQKQLLELRGRHGYLFVGAGERGGAEIRPPRERERRGMNQILRGE